jgi:hypothetical protein
MHFELLGDPAAARVVRSGPWYARSPLELLGNESVETVGFWLWDLCGLVFGLLLRRSVWSIAAAEQESTSQSRQYGK